MAKQVQPREKIHIAPGITGKKDDRDKLTITEDSTGETLHPENNIDHKIKIFKKQVNGWFLKRGYDLLEREDNGFVVLMIATAYIEGIEQYRRGQLSNRNSRTFFTDGIKRIFGIDSSFDERLSDLYEELRCGLFHNGMTGPNIRINSEIYKEPIDLTDRKVIKINQRKFLEKIENDFEQYLSELKSPQKTNLKDNFDRMYKFK